jgi:hypothetical protein
LRPSGKAQLRARRHPRRSADDAERPEIGDEQGRVSVRIWDLLPCLCEFAAGGRVSGIAQARVPRARTSTGPCSGVAGPRLPVGSAVPRSAAKVAWRLTVAAANRLTRDKRREPGRRPQAFQEQGQRGFPGRCRIFARVSARSTSNAAMSSRWSAPDAVGAREEGKPTRATGHSSRVASRNLRSTGLVSGWA